MMTEDNFVSLDGAVVLEKLDAAEVELQSVLRALEASDKDGGNGHTPGCCCKVHLAIRSTRDVISMIRNMVE